MRHKFNEDGSYMDDMPFGEYIRKKRRILGMNQTDFAKLLGVNQGTISMWELRVTSPPIDDATEIIQRLGGEVRILNQILGTPECPLGYNPWQE